MEPVHCARPGRRRALFALAFALPAACTCLPGEREPDAAAAQDAPRPCALGQQWLYQVRNVFNGEIIDQVSETVVETEPLIRIARTSAAHGTLPDEIQSSWGMIVQDPHWPQPAVFETPLPAWPARAGGQRHYSDRYRVSDTGPYTLWWDLRQRPLGHRTLDVPAGRFRTLHFANSIAFRSPDSYFRIDSTREESVWFAPSVGRWVQRRSCGTYFIEGRGGKALEDCLQWELLAWK